MLSSTLVQEIAHLLELGELSHRQIAVRLNISRGTVSNIASGRRGLHGREPKKLRSPTTRSAAPARCPTCGHRVYLPCRFCRAREHHARKLLAGPLAAQRPRNVAAGASPPSPTDVHKKSRAAAQGNGRTKSPA